MIPHSSCSITSDDFGYIDQIIKMNHVGSGDLVKQFKESLKNGFGGEGVVLTNSGTYAIELALTQLKSGEPGKREVIVSAYTCPSVVNAIIRTGLQPVLADVMTDSMNICTDSVQEKFNSNTLTVISTHIAGRPDQCHVIEELEIPWISDCCQAVGAELNGKPLTRYGAFSIISFGSTKPFTTGSGGALIVNDVAFLKNIEKQVKVELSPDEYLNGGYQVTDGQNFSDLNAGLGLSQLRKFPAFLKQRLKICSLYTEELLKSNLVKPNENIGNGYRYYFLSDEADRWINHFRQNGIDARGSISHDISQYFSEFKKFINVRNNASRLVSIPVHPMMNEDDVEKVLSCIRLGQKLGFEK